MNIDQLNYLLVLEKTGSVSRAARQLGISRTALNNYLKKLETKTGAPLLDRSGGELRLTPAGEIFLRHAGRIHEIYREMCAAGLSGKNTAGAGTAGSADSDARSAGSGVLRIGVTPHRGASFIGSVWGTMLERFPDLQMETVEGYSMDLAELLLQGKIDMAMISLQQIPSGIHALLLQTEPLYLVVPESLSGDLPEYFPGPADAPCAAPPHLTRVPEGDLAQAPEADPEVLKRLPLAFQDETSALGRTVLSFLAEQDLEPKDLFTAPNLRVITSLINAGRYAGILPAAHIQLRYHVRCLRIRGLDALRFYMSVPAGRPLTEQERYLLYLHVQSRNAFEDGYEAEVQEILSEFRKKEAAE